MRGYITDFNEQGMEGEYWLCFQDEAFINGDNWDRAGMHRLSNGSHLTIFSPAGAVCWSGIIGQRRTTQIDEWIYKLRQWFKYGRGYDLWHPENMTRKEWERLFRERPHLEAEYVLS